MSRMMDSGPYEYEDEESISAHLKCSLCSKPLVRPVSVRCKNKQQTYCQDCIKEHINRNHSCPSCGRNLNIQNLTPVTNEILTNILNDLPVKCPNCGQTPLKRGSLPDHRNQMCTSVDTSSDLPSNIPFTRRRVRNQLRENIDDENQQLKDQRNQNESEIKMLQDKNQHLRIQLDRQHTETETTENENRCLRSELNQKRIRVDTLERKNEQLTKRMNEQETAIENFENENRQLKLELDQQNDRIEKLVKENNELRVQIDLQKNRIDQQQNRETEQDAKIETLKGENRQLKTQVNDLQYELKEQKRKTERLQRDLEQLRNVVYRQPTGHRRSNADLRGSSSATNSRSSSADGFGNDDKQANDYDHMSQAQVSQLHHVMKKIATCIETKLSYIESSTNDAIENGNGNFIQETKRAQCELTIIKGLELFWKTANKIESHMYNDKEFDDDLRQLQTKPDSEVLREYLQQNAQVKHLGTIKRK